MALPCVLSLIFIETTSLCLSTVAKCVIKCQLLNLSVKFKTDDFTVIINYYIIFIIFEAPQRTLTHPLLKPCLFPHFY